MTQKIHTLKEENIKASRVQNLEHDILRCLTINTSSRSTLHKHVTDTSDTNGELQYSETRQYTNR